ncbi:MAG: sensor histidine kinase, partial [Burkholderiales bacterium]|nr:sensor histidine kinase [Burkholderiales bacterium]
LTVLALDLSWLQKRTNHTEQPVADKLKAAKGLIDSAIKTTRSIMQDLRPTLLDDVGIAAAIRWQSEECAKRNGIACKTELFDEQAKLDKMCSISLFRILQEALTNITRHAQASEVRIALRLSDGGVALEVVDNGIGIAPDAAHKPMSHGLTGMRERVRRLGGRIVIAAPSGGGTRIEVVLPAATVHTGDASAIDAGEVKAGDHSFTSLSIVSR